MPGPMMGLGPRGFLTDQEKENLPKVTWGLIKRILSYLKPYTLQFVFVFVAILLSAVMVLAILPITRLAMHDFWKLVLMVPAGASLAATNVQPPASLPTPPSAVKNATGWRPTMSAAVILYRLQTHRSLPSSVMTTSM